MRFYEDQDTPACLDIALAGARQTRIDLGSQAGDRVLEVGIGNGPTCPAVPTRPSLKPGSQILFFSACPAAYLRVTAALSRAEDASSQRRGGEMMIHHTS